MVNEGDFFHQGIPVQTCEPFKSAPTDIPVMAKRILTEHFVKKGMILKNRDRFYIGHS